MELREVIKTRRSVRSFDPAPISEEDKAKLMDYISTIDNPYGIPVTFVLLDAEEFGLSSPVLTGASLYVAGKVEACPHSEEAFGYAFEKLVLYAWSLGIGTTLIGGTMNRELFEQAAGLKENERMYCMSPLGYPAKKMSFKEMAMRKGVRADWRMDAAKLFFDGDFNTPLAPQAEPIATALEMVRLAPSAVNKQPWRIVKAGDRYHFYVRHSKGFTGEGSGDMQKIDLGIALCHFMAFVKGTLTLEDPGIAAEADTEYLATVTVSA